MRKGFKYDVWLFAILAVLMFLPMVEEHTGFLKCRPLHGLTEEKERPHFSFESYVSGDFGRQLEAYIGEHFGFRELVIRIYNQYLWDCFRKTYATYPQRGKEGWLFAEQSVNDYYGTEMYRWHSSAEEARKAFYNESKYMGWVRDILKENGVEMLAFIAPEKSFLYPEFLPDREFDTTTFSACDYFTKRFDTLGFPYIEMTRWFKQIKDTVDYALIPQTGGHWNFSSVLAADSLFRFMGELKGVSLPTIKIGAANDSLYSSAAANQDLENLFNLMWTLPHTVPDMPEAEVTVEVNAKSVKPKVLFIGNSFLWRINYYVPLNQVFSEVEFWYYFNTAYSGKKLWKSTPLNKTDLLERLLDFDYIVWFNTGNQLNKLSSGFAKLALLDLCVSDSLMQEHITRIADSLRYDSLTRVSYADYTPEEYEKELRRLGHYFISLDPSLIPELRGDILPSIRNAEIPYAKVIKDIRKDSLWMAALEDQGFLRSATFKTMLHAEADHIMQGKPLFKDQADELKLSRYYKQEVEKEMEKFRQSPKTMEIISAKAKEKNKDFEEALRDDAIWVVKKRYGLSAYRLAINPDAAIDLAPLYKFEIQRIENEIWSDTLKLNNMRAKAETKGKTLEKAIHDDAVWMVKRKYHLNEINCK